MERRGSGPKAGTRSRSLLATGDANRLILSYPSADDGEGQDALGEEAEYVQGGVPVRSTYLGSARALERLQHQQGTHHGMDACAWLSCTRRRCRCRLSDSLKPRYRLNTHRDSPFPVSRRR